MNILRTIEEHPIGSVLISALFIIWWYGVWGLMDEVAKHLHERHRFSYHSIYLACFFGVILFIPLFPSLLEKF